MSREAYFYPDSSILPTDSRLKGALFRYAGAEYLKVEAEGQSIYLEFSTEVNIEEAAKVYKEVFDAKVSSPKTIEACESENDKRSAAIEIGARCLLLVDLRESTYGWIEDHRPFSDCEDTISAISISEAKNIIDERHRYLLESLASPQVSSDLNDTFHYVSKLNRP